MCAVLTSHHHHLNASETKSADRFADTMLRWILEGGQGDETVVCARVVHVCLRKFRGSVELRRGEKTLSTCNDAMPPRGHVLHAG